jgi:hypothetical protein
MTVNKLEARSGYLNNRFFKKRIFEYPFFLKKIYYTT